jgi:hypothetical protein
VAPIRIGADTHTIVKCLTKILCKLWLRGVGPLTMDRIAERRGRTPLLGCRVTHWIFSAIFGRRGGKKFVPIERNEGNFFLLRRVPLR